MYDYVTGLKLNAECISGGFAALIKGPDNCISTYSDNIVAVMLNGTGDVEIEYIMCRFVNLLSVFILYSLCFFVWFFFTSSGFWCLTANVM